MQTGNLVRLTIQGFPYSSALSWLHRNRYHSQLLMLCSYNFPFRACTDVQIWTTQLYGNNHHRIWIHYLGVLMLSTSNLRVAFRRVIEVKTQQYTGLWVGERVAWSLIKIECHIILTHHFASNNLADLRFNIQVISWFQITYEFTWRLFASPFPPKYQNCPIRVAPHPRKTDVLAPYSKLRSSL